MGWLETWYRGLAIGVPPGKPEANLYDFGHGMYLTDRPDVAETYAARRTKARPDAGRVFVVTLERRSLGLVLDLSLDARWHLFMNDPSDKFLLGKPRLHYLRIKHELYAQFFNEFLQKHQIDMRSYDAVIGPEYTTGGRQLCIRSKNGLPTKLQERVRKLFRPFTSKGGGPSGGGGAEGSGGGGKTGGGETSSGGAKGTPPARAGRVQTGPSRIRVAGRVLGGGMLRAGAGVFMGWLQVKATQWLIGKGIQDLEEEIGYWIASSRPRIAGLQIAGNKAYANVTIEVWSTHMVDVDMGMVVETDTTPIVSLKVVDVTSQQIDKQGTFRAELDKADPQETDYYWPYVFSLEVSLPQADVDQYKLLLDEIDRLKAALSNPALPQAESDQLMRNMTLLQGRLRQWLDSD